jgi:hypothetical protein
MTAQNEPNQKNRLRQTAVGATSAPERPPETGVPTPPRRDLPRYRRFPAEDDGAQIRAIGTDAGLIETRIYTKQHPRGRRTRTQGFEHILATLSVLRSSSTLEPHGSSAYLNPVARLRWARVAAIRAEIQAGDGPVTSNAVISLICSPRWILSA